MRAAPPSLCLIFGAAALAALQCAGAWAATPPIDCREARTDVDKQICASPADVALDREIAALYDRGLAEFSPADRHALAASQLKFLHARAGCAWATHHSAHPEAALSECVRTKMEERERSLRHAVDRGGYGK
jgi:uncharacterized protein